MQRSYCIWVNPSCAIDTGEIIEGRLPPRVLGLVQEWREYHKDELNENWNLARNRRPLKSIKPLE
ncbi:MAG: DUF4160 domain-containing protein [Candidatus Loosdrechtia sp.]|uniref:DUF4160 domain-containing protein n=1 Tax=Candidatus Loosdrechtia sp. TaxID=3101272 RepID=UPI00403AF41C